MLERLFSTIAHRVRAAQRSTLALVALGACAWLVTFAVLSASSEDVVEHNGAQQLDASRLHWIVDHRWGPLVSAARIFSDIGGVAIVAVLAVLASAALWWRRVPLGAALVPAAAVASAGLVAAVAKVVVHRARPGVAYRLVVENDLSFPSGHSTGSMALGASTAIVVAVYLLRRPLARAFTLLAGVAVPLAIGLSRLELGVHWPTDVVAGLALGLLAALTFAAGAMWFIATPPADPGDSSWPARLHRVMLFTRRERGLADSGSGLTSFAG